MRNIFYGLMVVLGGTGAVFSVMAYTQAGAFG